MIAAVFELSVAQQMAVITSAHQLVGFPLGKLLEDEGKRELVGILDPLIKAKIPGLERRHLVESADRLAYLVRGLKYSEALMRRNELLDSINRVARRFAPFSKMRAFPTSP